MHGRAPSRSSLSYEEKLALLEERSSSDESEGDRSDYMTRLREFAYNVRPPFSVDRLHQIPDKLHSLPDKLQKLPDAPTLARGALRAFFSIPWRLMVIRALIFLVPSFLQPCITGEKKTRQERLIPTAYLDGMRGLAALFVYFCHYTYQSFVIAEGWGHGETNYHWLKLPFLRLWYQGPPMVCVFFVISGYALSLKPLKQMRANQWDGFSGTMSSMTFRRAIRLFVPTALSTLLVVFFLRIGAYEKTREFALDKTYMKNVVEDHPERLETLSEQMWVWAHQMWIFLRVFNWDQYGAKIKLDVHLWTIPVEFRCSLYLFLVLIGTARLRTWVRMAVVWGVTLFSWYNVHWELVLFFCGMMLAELDLIRGAHNQHAATPPSQSGPLLGSPAVSEKPRGTCSSQMSKAKALFWSLWCIGALYLMNQPDIGDATTPGWVYLGTFVPKWWSNERYRFWQSIGSVLFVYGVGYSAGWQRFFNTAVVQYFGKISYAIYLMHGPIMHTAGYMIERWAYGITGVEGYWYNGGFVLGFVFAVPTVVWAADIFWRAVDVPTVKFARWVETKCLKAS